MYYTTIPLVSERPHNRRWDASKLRDLRKRLDTSTITTEEIDNVAADFLDGEIVDLASDWLGNTVRAVGMSSSYFCHSHTTCHRWYRSSSRSVPLALGWQCWSGLHRTLP